MPKGAKNAANSNSNNLIRQSVRWFLWEKEPSFEAPLRGWGVHHRSNTCAGGSIGRKHKERAEKDKKERTKVKHSEWFLHTDHQANSGAQGYRRRRAEGVFWKELEINRRNWRGWITDRTEERTVLRTNTRTDWLRQVRFSQDEHIGSQGVDQRNEHKRRHTKGPGGERTAEAQEPEPEGRQHALNA